MKTNYLIVYTALDKSGQVIRKGTMRAKNKLSGLTEMLKCFGNVFIKKI